MRTGRLAVSDVILGRLSHVPIVTIAVPLFDAAGAIAGVAGGSLDLSQVRAVRRGLPDAARRAHHDRRSARSRDLRERPDRRSRRCRDLAQDEIVLGERAAPRTACSATSGTLDGAGESARLAAAAVIAPTGWKIFVEQPLVNMRLQSTGYYAFTLALMLLAFAGAVLGARGVLRRGHPAARGSGHGRAQHLGPRRRRPRRGSRRIRRPKSPRCSKT